MNRSIFIFLISLFFLISCGSAPVKSVTTVAEPTQEATNPPAVEGATPTAVVIAESAATQAAPPTLTTDNTAAPAPDNEPIATPTPSNLPPEGTGTIYTDYNDKLHGLTTQRPIDWTVHFPQQNMISSYVSAENLSSTPPQSYANFSYEVVGQYTELGQPDLAAMLLSYLQQNVSPNIALPGIHSLELASYPAALWLTEFEGIEGARRTEQQWLLFSRPNIYRIKTISQVADNGASYEDELQKMMQSLQFSEASLLRGILQVGRYAPYVADNLFYTSSSNGIAFSYPQGGFVNDVPGQIAIVSDESLYDGFDKDEAGYAVYYHKLEVGSSAEPSLELAQSLVAIPDISSRLVDQTTVQIDRYSADAVLYRNRPDNRFTYELAVYVINQSDGQLAIVSVKYGNAAPAVWNEGVVGSILFGP